MIGYLCAYLRFYHPHAFIVAYLNHAKTDEDIKARTELAHAYGIQVIPPRFGKSKDKYVYNADSKTIGKGVASVKYLNDDIANSLYRLSQENQYTSFVDVLSDMQEQTSIDTRQLDILIKLDYFSDFGNQTELQRIVSVMNTFKYGDAKTIRKDKVNGKFYEPLVEQYASGVNKNGSPSVSYTFIGEHTEEINNTIKGTKVLLKKAQKTNNTDAIDFYTGILNEQKQMLDKSVKESVMKLLRECEKQIKLLSLPDIPLKTKIQNQLDLLGYIEMATGKSEDRRKLFVMKARPLLSRVSNLPWAYVLETRSLGSGVTSSLTVRADDYKFDPIQKGDIIYASQLHHKVNPKTEIVYWYLDSYYKIM